MTIIHITPGHSCLTATVPDDREGRWCFGCRRRLPHTWSMLFDGPERQPTYYDPLPVLKCSGCGDDRTAFPGAYPDGPHYPESEATWRRLCVQHALTVQGWDWDSICKRDRERAAAFRETDLTEEAE